MKITAKVETITPHKARKLLEQNKTNRPLRDALILEYGSAMEAGEWMANGESIKIDSNGNLAGSEN